MKKSRSNNLIVGAVLAIVMAISGFFVYANSVDDNHFLAFVKNKKDIGGEIKQSEINSVANQIVKANDFEINLDNGFKVTGENKEEEEQSVYYINVSKKNNKKITEIERKRIFKIYNELLKKKEVEEMLVENTNITNKQYSEFTEQILWEARDADPSFNIHHCDGNNACPVGYGFCMVCIIEGIFDELFGIRIVFNPNAIILKD